MSKLDESPAGGNLEKITGVITAQNIARLAIIGLITGIIINRMDGAQADVDSPHISEISQPIEDQASDTKKCALAGLESNC